MCIFPVVAKKQRLDDANEKEGKEEEVCPLVCLSPNACCVLLVHGQSLQVYQIINPILGLKGMCFSCTTSI